jgi:aspartate racemase
MQADFYPKVFSANGVGLIVPRPNERDYIHEKYMTELLKGQFLPQTRESLLRIIERLKNDEQIDGLILAGTELPLILRDAPDQGIPFLDTTQLHVEAAVELLLK